MSHRLPILGFILIVSSSAVRADDDKAKDVEAPARPVAASAETAAKDAKIDSQPANVKEATPPASTTTSADAGKSKDVPHASGSVGSFATPPETASSPEHRPDHHPGQPPKLRGNPDDGAEAAAEAELAQAQQMADQAIAAASAQQQSSTPYSTYTPSTTSTKVRNPHHSMGELVNSIEYLGPDPSDTTHHTTSDIF